MDKRESNKKNTHGYISSIIGSLIKVKGLENHVKLHDLIKISRYNIIGEVIQIYSNSIVAQCFENTINVRLNEEVISLNEPLSMELGPGLISKIFDGIQRPLELVFKDLDSGGLKRGVKFSPLSRTTKWHFTPLKRISEKVQSGDVIGIVQETKNFEHRIMVPPYTSGILTDISDEGDYTVVDEIYKLKINSQEKPFSMIQKWPITVNRPYTQKLNPSEPLITGIRAIDLLFPIAKGGTTAIPGGFGTGKTVIQQMLAKWSNADVCVYIGCGEPGNEIANVLKQFTETINPQTGRPLLERIVLIANTSNMPVSAREASLFSGVTIAEYFRDMGYDIAVLADSTSRWAESLREISGLLEEMPAEEGYPAYLPSKLSNFYERAGVVRTLGQNNKENGRRGSISIIGTISPPAADFSEPVTSTTKRLVQSFWALDSKLAYLKHYPAINWKDSYSNYGSFISKWWHERDIDWAEIDIDWAECRNQVNDILSKEQELSYIVQLIGEKNLPTDQQIIIYLAKLIRNGFLIQNAFDDIDNYTNAKKLLGIIKIILLIYYEGEILIEKGILIEEFLDSEIVNEILKIKHSIKNEEFYLIEELKNKLLGRLRSITL